MYKIQFTNFVSDFFEAIHEYDDLQPLNDHIPKTCKDVEKPIYVKVEEDTININCPINLKVGVGIGKFKISCKGWELEGGQLLVITIDKDFKSGEFSFAFGLGGSVEVGLLDIGAKGQMFFKFNKDFSPIDCGMKFEGGGEVNASALNAEEKMSAVIGMTSGIHVIKNHLGREITAWELDPRK